MKDKIAHAIVSAAIVVVTVYACRLFLPPIFIPFYQLGGVCLAMIWGWAKETWDYKRGGLFDKHDLVADLIGALFGVLVS